MSSKNKRAGGKYTNNHTSMIPLASLVADIADGCEWITKISPGFIKAGLRPAKGKRRVKITEKNSGFLLSVRDNISHQEIHIYASNIQEAKEYIATEIKNMGVEVLPENKKIL